MYFAPCCSALGLSAKVQTAFGSRFSPETAHIERSRQACPMCTPSNAPMVSTVRPDSGRSLSVMIFKKKSSFLSFPPRSARGIGYKHNQNREKQGRKTSFAIAVKQAARPQAGGNGGGSRPRPVGRPAGAGLHPARVWGTRFRPPRRPARALSPLRFAFRRRRAKPRPRRGLENAPSLTSRKGAENVRFSCPTRGRVLREGKPSRRGGFRRPACASRRSGPRQAAASALRVFAGAFPSCGAAAPSVRRLF